MGHEGNTPSWLTVMAGLRQPAGVADFDEARLEVFGDIVVILGQPLQQLDQIGLMNDRT